MKKLIKTGRVSALNLRTIKRDEFIGASFELDGIKFSGVFSTDFSLEQGDLVRVKYERDGFINRITLLETLAKNSENKSKTAKIINIAVFISLTLLALCIAGGVIFSLITGRFEIRDFTDIIRLIGICFLVWSLAYHAIGKFKILRHFA